MADDAAESNGPQPTSPPASDMRGTEHTALLRAASDPALTADQALALLDRADLPADVIEQLAKRRSALKLPKAKLTLACHAHTPRHISVPLIRHFYTFDLMKVALSLVVPADVKLVADETLLSRLKTITSGERLTLARRASGRIAGALLNDSEERIMCAALENARLTEVLVIQAVLKAEASAALVHCVSQHAKWSYRRDVQLALLRTEHLSLARALALSRELSAAHLADILRTSRLPSQIKTQLLNQKTQAKAATEAG